MRKLYLCIILLVAVIALIGCSGESKDSKNKRTASCKAGSGVKKVVHPGIMKSSAGNDGIIEYVPEYDSEGKVTSITYYNGDGSINRAFHYKYDSSGKKIAKIAEYSRVGSQFSCLYTKFEYDADGYLNKTTFNRSAFTAEDGKEEIAFNTHAGFNPADIDTYEYHRTGGVLDLVIMKRGGDLLHTNKFEYNSNGDISKYSQYDNLDNPVSTETWTWDYDARTLKRNAGTDSTTCYTWTYDSKWRLIGYYNPSGTLLKELSYTEEEGEDVTGGAWITWNTADILPNGTFIDNQEIGLDF